MSDQQQTYEGNPRSGLRKAGRDTYHDHLIEYHRHVSGCWIAGYIDDPEGPVIAEADTLAELRAKVEDVRANG